MSLADRRYPHMHPVDGRTLPRVPDGEVRRIHDAAREVSARTGTRPWWNTRSGELMFSLGDDAKRFVGAFRVFDVRRQLRVDANLDNEVRVITSARRRKSAEIDRELAERAAREAHEAAEERAAIADNARYAAKDLLKHERNKAQMGGHYRPSITLS